MQLDITPQTKSELEAAAKYCDTTTETLVRLFVEDGLRLYGDNRDEFRDTLTTDGENR